MADAVLFHLRHMRRNRAAPQQATVDLRVERLDAAVKHFRKAGVVADFGDRDTRVPEGQRRTAGGKDGDTHAGECAAEFDDSGLV